MKRTISALALCCSLLAALSLFLFPSVVAKDNVVLSLLGLPAPPPPNPFLPPPGQERDRTFFNTGAPPKDDAPIDDILAYWYEQSGRHQDLRYQPEMSAAVRARIMKEISKDPILMPGLLNALRNDPEAASFVKEVYDREALGGVFNKEQRRGIKRWLTYNSTYFSDHLARVAGRAADTENGYVTNHDELLALVNVDFDKARPIIDRLYGDTSLMASRVLARWALYRHALATGSTSDIERYRDELKAIVADRTATAGMRDMAMDALVAEKGWDGRDDWYYSQLADESLAELDGYTGLTTMILVSPDEKYIDKMLELAASNNAAVRAAAVRNLVLRIENGGEGVIRALLPWLEDPAWAADTGNSRYALISKLSEVRMPESVPGLIKVLNEKETQVEPIYAPNMAANAAVRAAEAAQAAANAMVANRALSVRGELIDTYPHRSSAIMALAHQRDPRAVPALKQLLTVGPAHEHINVVSALLACGGFTIAEQIDALENQARNPRGVTYGNVSANTNAAMYNSNYMPDRPATSAEINVLLGQVLLQRNEIADDLARALVARIEALERSDIQAASVLRKIILRWQNAAIDLLFLSDVKRGRADMDTIVRLLSQRKTLRENQSSYVFDLRTGGPMAVGIAACLLEDPTDHVTILENGDTETKTALLACARLIRASIPVTLVAASLDSQNALLATAAERYLESEDSPEARTILLGRYPDEAKIYGAFYVEGAAGTSSDHLSGLYKSIGNGSGAPALGRSRNDDELAAIAKRLQEEVKKDDEVVGIYAYDRNYVRIYKDRVIYSWEEDDARYRERPLSKSEFNEIRSYLTTNDVDQLPPFLTCGGEHCAARELLMLGRGGGRRVYMNGDPSAFFIGLDRYFAALKQAPATLKYTLSRDIPGLEILFASDDLYAETVWHAPGDLRIAARDIAESRKISAEIEELINDYSETGYDEENEAEVEARLISLRQKQRSGVQGWHRVANGSVTGSAVQPAEVEFIPIGDTLSVKPAADRWKARAGDIEIRASDDGIFKVVRGQMTKLRSGSYSNVVITPNGRWAAALKVNEDYGVDLVRIDLASNREYKAEIDEHWRRYAVAYVPTVNKFLIVQGFSYGSGRHGDLYDDHDEDHDGPPRPDYEPDGMVLLDPATGSVQPIAGEFRPLSQQTFRPLQQTARANEFWAAIVDREKNETQVGVFDTKVFGFKPMLTVPKMEFTSMDMWVDEAARKVYFVYRGHVLALPLNK